MDNLYFKFLNEFEKTGLSAKKSISPFMEKHFPKPLANSSEPIAWSKENRNADLFIDDIRNTGHFDFETDESGHIKPGRWYDVVNIYARITISGLAYLDDYRANKRVQSNSNIQTVAISLTVLLTVVTLIVTLNNSNSDVKLDRLQTHIREQNKQIHTLQIELSKASNELLHLKEEKKNSPKKP